MFSVDSIRVSLVSLSSLVILPVVLFANVAQAQPTSAPSSPWPYDDVPLPSPKAPSVDSPEEEAARPREPASAPFGAQGQFVLGGGTSLGVSSSQWDSSAATDFSVQVTPVLDYFVFKNFSIGLALNVGYEDSRGYDANSNLVENTTTSFSAGPRFGLNIPLGSAVSWWPQATFAIESNRWSSNVVTPNPNSTASPPAPTATSQDGPSMDLYLPLLVHPVPHFFMGAGPEVFHDFGAVRGGSNVGDQRTTIGAGFIVGGYWGGSPVKTSAPGSETPAPVLKHFGDQGEVVFSSDLLSSVYSTTYSGTPGSTLSGQMTLGVDYFVVDHFEVGGGLAGTVSSSNSSDANGNPVTSNNSSYGFFLRTGVDIPLAGPISLYPSLLLGVADGSTDEKSTAGENSYSFSEVWVAGYVPFVLEIAPHFFAGLGPSVRRDVSNTATFPQGQQVSNPGATFGAGFIVGGWL